jgi:hypothetical protein
LDGRRLSGLTEEVLEFLVEFQVDVPEGTPDSEVERRERAAANVIYETYFVGRRGARPISDRVSARTSLDIRHMSPCAA